MGVNTRKQVRLNDRSKKRTKAMKLLNAQPVIKNVDVQAIKAEFAANKAK